MVLFGNVNLPLAQAQKMAAEVMACGLPCVVAPLLPSVTAVYLPNKFPPHGIMEVIWHHTSK
jgi:hypothetical protein